MPTCDRVLELFVVSTLVQLRDVVHPVSRHHPFGRNTPFAELYKEGKNVDGGHAVLLMQVGIVMPACLAILDVAAARDQGRTLSLRRYLLLPFRNPITIGILLGLAVNLTGLALPADLMRPIDMIGAFFFRAL